MRSPVLDMLLKLVDFKQGISSSFCSYALNAITPVLLLTLIIKVSVDQKTENYSSKRGPPGYNNHRSNAKDYSHECCRLVIVLPLRSPVR